MVIGWVLVLFAFLVMFFHPAAMKLGEIRFEVIAESLVVLGLILNIVGARVRARNRNENAAISRRALDCASFAHTTKSFMRTD